MEIRRGKFIFNFNFIHNSNWRFCLICYELNRFRNKILSGDLFQYFSALSIVNFKISLYDIVCSFCIFMVSECIIWHKKRVLQREFASL